MPKFVKCHGGQPGVFYRGFEGAVVTGPLPGNAAGLPQQMIVWWTAFCEFAEQFYPRRRERDVARPTRLTFRNEN